ncbi:MAG TPA: FAD-dependent oxidoreductase, partial [Gemmatimonadaceae bacterium]|nr:FAD-dependent oxidoreductase [Gemmatimonadaceae bacterium]
MHARPIPDAVIVGGGLAALATAAALAEHGCRVTMLSAPRPGAASAAAAGMLAPSVERGTGAAHDFAILARDRYPEYLAWLAERSGVTVPLDRAGVLEVAFTQDDVERLRAAQGTADWLDATELAAAEPGLGRALGAVRHPDDGAVDNRLLLRALRALVDAHHRIEVHEVDVAAVRPGSHAGAARGGTAHGSPAAITER